VFQTKVFCDKIKSIAAEKSFTVDIFLNPKKGFKASKEPFKHEISVFFPSFGANPACLGLDPMNHLNPDPDMDQCGPKSGPESLIARGIFMPRVFCRQQMPIFLSNLL
jgi:hypothetical protein